MNEPFILTGPVATGIIMSVVLSILFLAQESYKKRKKRVQYARLIEVELNRIRDIVKPLPWTRFNAQTNYLTGSLPRNAYDGLVSSATVSVFDIALQHQLHVFYENVADRQYDHLRSSIEFLLDDVYRFRRRNEQRRNFFLWWRQDV